MAYKAIIVEFDEDVALIRLNRPDALNALNNELLGELCDALIEADDSKGSVILLHGRGFHPDWQDVVGPVRVALAEEGWSSVHTVIEKNSFWEVIDELKNAGAEGLLVVPIEKMVL